MELFGLQLFKFSFGDIEHSDFSQYASDWQSVYFGHLLLHLVSSVTLLVTLHNASSTLEKPHVWSRAITCHVYVSNQNLATENMKHVILGPTEKEICLM